jgi:hypothetical protein
MVAVERRMKTHHPNSSLHIGRTSKWRITIHLRLSYGRK